jgi:phage tail-like protein
MAVVDPNFPHDLYRFIPKNVRDQDAQFNQLLERFLKGPQTVWESSVATLQQLPTLHNIDTIADEWLVFLKWQVGWTNGRDLEAITDSLTDDELRKLISFSSKMWKLKGTELGLADTLRVLTGRDVVIRNWFSFRWILGVTGLWRLGRETDSWLAGETYGDRDEYLTILWIHNEIGIQRQLIRKIVNLCRPLQEAVKIGYADLVDDFRFGRQKWITDVAPDVVWDDENFKLVLAQNTTIRANVPALETTGDFVWRHRITFNGPTDGAHSMEFHRSSGGAHNRYIVTWEQPGNVFLQVSLGGVVTTLASTTISHDFPQDEPQVIGVNVIRETPSTLRVQVVVYDDEVIDTVLTGGNVLSSGQWRLINTSTDDLVVDDVVAYKLPLVVDEVNGSGEVVG